MPRTAPSSRPAAPCRALPPVRFLVLKLASACNLDCDYCYWFRDPSVLRAPRLLTRAAAEQLVQRIREHIAEYNLTRFGMLFHGGEPLLYGRDRFASLSNELKRESSMLGCPLGLAITTNGVTLDRRWARLFRDLDVRVTLSIDGPASIHDAHRIDQRGRGSHAAVVRALEALRDEGVEPGVLAVCDPASDPEQVVGHLVDELGVDRFDILFPDATHDDRPPSIYAYYARLFDLWYDDLAHRGIVLRTTEALLNGVLGRPTTLDSFGVAPVQALTVTTDGSLEPLDSLRIAGEASTRTSASLFTHTLQEAQYDPVWQRAYRASRRLPAECRNCEWRKACGGGALGHRWSSEGGYDNPSVYCGDLKQLFAHAWRRASRDIEVSVADGQVRLCDLLPEQGADA